MASPLPPRENPFTPPAEASGNADALRTISPKQASRIWALGFSNGVDKKLIIQILQGHGFERAEHVASDKYEEICAAIENAGAGAAH